MPPSARPAPLDRRYLPGDVYIPQGLLRKQQSCEVRGSYRYPLSVTVPRTKRVSDSSTLLQHTTVTKLSHFKKIIKTSFMTISWTPNQHTSNIIKLLFCSTFHCSKRSLAETHWVVVRLKCCTLISKSCCTHSRCIPKDVLLFYGLCSIIMKGMRVIHPLLSLLTNTIYTAVPTYKH